MTLTYGRELQDPETARNLEYLMTCSHGCCSSSAGGNTRKYHGLFTYRGRVLFAGLDELVNGVRISAQMYRGTREEPGLRHLFAFSVYPPRWSYMIGDVFLEKEVTFLHGVTITYRSIGKAGLLIRPLVTDRPVDRLARAPRPSCTLSKSGFFWSGIWLEGTGRFTEDPQSYWNLRYFREEERGYESEEDLFSPGFFQITLDNSSFTIHCYPSNLAPGKRAPEMPSASLRDHLDRSSDAFRHHDEIYAGYPWFCESWGRDTAVSVTGLLILRDKKEEARAVLSHLANNRRNGIIPNRFPDNYHTSDASLWFIHALGRYRQRWGDDPFVMAMHPVVAEILESYPASGITSLDHGLIRVAPGTTWMDTAFTPREGKPVEVNALWIHALEEAESMGISPPVPPETAREEFAAFWNGGTGCLYDVIDPPDPSIRPNQIAALAFGLMPEDQASAALSTISRDLLTPYGLRSLSPRDPRYRGRFTGDASYHNGCIWPWLIGMYVDALLRQGVPRDSLGPLLDPLLAHVREAGAGYISEIFDGDAPHTPRGCIAQAWSVAEIGRACRMVFG